MPVGSRIPLGIRAVGSPGAGSPAGGSPAVAGAPSNADPRIAYEVRQLIKSRRGRCTLIVSSHNLQELEEICDSAIILDRGHMCVQSSEPVRRGWSLPARSFSTTGAADQIAKRERPNRGPRTAGLQKLGIVDRPPTC